MKVIDGERMFTSAEMSDAVQRRLRAVKQDSAPRAVLDAALARIRELETEVEGLRIRLGDDE